MASSVAESVSEWDLRRQGGGQGSPGHGLAKSPLAPSSSLLPRLASFPPLFPPTLPFLPWFQTAVEGAIM